MPDWFELLTAAIQSDDKAVLVTVVAVDGSVPREVGAGLVISANGHSGTVGGGNLEFTCIRDAHEMLARNHVRTCKQISLGPALGQCCGGRVEMLFELVDFQTDWYIELTASHHSPDSRWLCRSLESSDSLIAAKDALARLLPSGTDSSHELKNTDALVVRNDNERWLIQSLFIPKPSVWVYGAGHVGQAVVSQLCLLECQVTLLDHREEWQCLQPNLDITRILTDVPQEDSVDAPVDAAHVVMTHSHSVDFEICHALLKRGQFGWLGLIGSNTKRQTFINRLKQRGVSECVIERLRCPIGGLQLESSRPALISLNLAAELALHWEQAGKIR